MAKILLGISNGLLKGDDYYPSGFMEQIISELKNCGNDVLVYVPNRFQKCMFSASNELLETVDVDKLDEDIRNFNPDLVITFNNTIYNNVVNLTNCPIVVWGADTEPLWNSKDIIKQNLDRYFFFCFSEQEMAPRKELFGIKDNRIFLMKPATNVRNSNLQKDKNISFIGTCFSINPYWQNFIEKYRGRNSLRTLCNNFSSYFVEKNDLEKGIDDNELLEDFRKISQLEYISFFSGEKRAQTLMNIADLGLHIWGDSNWEKFKTSLPSLYACLGKDKITTLQENEMIYNTSKICININHDQSINGMNFRIFDILASGGCLVSSYSPFVKTQFKDIDIPMFMDSFEARKLCNILLKNDQLRYNLVKLSNEIINKEWRWVNRFKLMESILGLKLINTSLKGSISLLKPNFRYINNFSKNETHKKNNFTVSLIKRVKIFFYALLLILAQFPIFDLFMKRNKREKLRRKINKYWR